LKIPHFAIELWRYDERFFFYEDSDHLRLHFIVLIWTNIEGNTV